MPIPVTSEMPVPKSWDEFEDICADILKSLWEDPFATRNGRAGQAQNGVDVYSIASGSLDLETLVLDAEVLEELLATAEPKKTSREIEIKLVARLRKHKGIQRSLLWVNGWNV